MFILSLTQMHKQQENLYFHLIKSAEPYHVKG